MCNNTRYKRPINLIKNKSISHDLFSVEIDCIVNFLFQGRFYTLVIDCKQLLVLHFWKVTNKPSYLVCASLSRKTKLKRYERKQKKKKKTKNSQLKLVSGSTATSSNFFVFFQRNKNISLINLTVY